MTLLPVFIKSDRARVRIFVRRVSIFLALVSASVMIWSLFFAESSKFQSNLQRTLLFAMLAALFAGKIYGSARPVISQGLATAAFWLSILAFLIRASLLFAD
ncbi:hypothetical protein [Xanthomonas sp. WHRI 7945]|nr:hypothetical protein [Xanthomonas campestris pv. campestris]